MQRRKLVAALLVHLALAAACAARGSAPPGGGGGGGDNWAVLVGASRFWLNYRHTSNTMAVYRAVRRCAAGRAGAARARGGSPPCWRRPAPAAQRPRTPSSARRLGIPDSRIILMLADPAACNPRNARPGEVATSVPKPGAAAAPGGGLYAPDLQVDYRGRDVSVDSILRLLTGSFL